MNKDRMGGTLLRFFPPIPPTFISFCNSASKPNLLSSITNIFMYDVVVRTQIQTLFLLFGMSDLSQKLLDRRGLLQKKIIWDRNLEYVTLFNLIFSLESGSNFEKNVCDHIQIHVFISKDVNILENQETFLIFPHLSCLFEFLTFRFFVSYLFVPVCPWKSRKISNKLEIIIS